MLMSLRLVLSPLIVAALPAGVGMRLCGHLQRTGGAPAVRARVRTSRRAGQVRGVCQPERAGILRSATERGQDDAAEAERCGAGQFRVRRRDCRANVGGSTAGMACRSSRPMFTSMSGGAWLQSSCIVCARSICNFGVRRRSHALSTGSRQPAFMHAWASEFLAKCSSLPCPSSLPIG